MEHQNHNQNLKMKFWKCNVAEVKVIIYTSPLHEGTDLLLFIFFIPYEILVIKWADFMFLFR